MAWKKLDSHLEKKKWSWIDAFHQDKLQMDQNFKCKKNETIKLLDNNINVEN